MTDPAGNLTKLQDDVETCQRAVDIIGHNADPNRLRHAQDLLLLAKSRLARAQVGSAKAAPISAKDSPQTRQRALPVRLQPPDLQSLVTEHGSYEAIPQAAWRDYDARMDEYLTRIRLG